MKYILSILCFLILNFPGFSQEVPDDFFVEYHIWGWYGPSCNDIKYYISKDSSYFEVNCVNSHINKIPLTIKEYELLNLYKIIKENNFNKIQADSREYTIMDGPITRVEINMDNINHVIFTDGMKHINPENRNNYSEITKAIVQIFPDFKKEIILNFDEDLSRGETPFSLKFDNGNVVYYNGRDYYFEGMIVKLFLGKNSVKIIYGQTQNEKIFIDLTDKVKEIYFYSEDDKIKYKIK